MRIFGERVLFKNESRLQKPVFSQGTFTVREWLLLCPNCRRLLHGRGKTTSTNKTKQNPAKNMWSVTSRIPRFCRFPPTRALRTAWAPFLEGTMKDAQKHMWLQRNLQCWSSSPPTHSLPTVLPTVSLLLFLVDLFVLGSPSPQLKEALHTHWSIWGWLGRMMWLPTASKIWHQWKYEPNVPCMLGCEVFIAPLSLRAESMKEPDSLGSWFLLCLLIAGWHLWA